MGSTKKDNRTSKLMQITKDYAELLSRIGQFPLEFPKQQMNKWMSKTCMTGLGTFLYKSNGSIKHEHPRVISSQRENDKYIMVIAQYKSLNMCTIQHCWLYLQVCTISDIVEPNRESAQPDISNRCRQESKIEWVNQGMPPDTD